MAEQVNVQDAKTRLSELLQRVQNGEEISVAYPASCMSSSRMRKKSQI
jgi:hypothetical protein